MLTQSHREYIKPEDRGCFAVGKSRKEIFNDLTLYRKQHKNYYIFYFEHPVRPGKDIPVPEYMMEIEAYPKTMNRDWSVVSFWTRVQ